jgi:hypothetical protein
MKSFFLIAFLGVRNMKNRVFDEIEELQIFKSIQLVNDLMYNKGFRYSPFFFKDKKYNEYNLSIMKMDFKNVKNEEISMGCFVRNNKKDKSIVLKSLAKYINSQIVSNYDLTKNQTNVMDKDDIIKLIDSILES